MVEILGVLAVIGVLSVGGIAAYSKAMEKINTDQLIVDISTPREKSKTCMRIRKAMKIWTSRFTLLIWLPAHTKSKV